MHTAEVANWAARRRRRRGCFFRKLPRRWLGRFQPRQRNYMWRRFRKRHSGWPHLSRYGFAKAPKNTTSFLISDSEARRSPARPPVCYDSDGDDYFDREFVQIYEDYEEERLQSMSNVDLAVEILNLEDKIDELKTILKKLHTQPSRTLIRPPGFDPNAEGRMIAAYRRKIERLTVQNLNLEADNQLLELYMSRSRGLLNSPL